jgi:hypothetical protein
MKSILMPTALTLALAAWLTPAPVQAAGCLKGAAVGGVAGHVGCWCRLYQARATRQTSMRVNAPTRTEHLATAVSPATPLASAKAPVVHEECVNMRQVPKLAEV